MKHYCC